MDTSPETSPSNDTNNSDDGQSQVSDDSPPPPSSSSDSSESSPPPDSSQSPPPPSPDSSPPPQSPPPPSPESSSSPPPPPPKSDSPPPTTTADSPPPPSPPPPSQKADSPTPSKSKPESPPPPSTAESAPSPNSTSPSTIFAPPPGDSSRSPPSPHERLTRPPSSRTSSSDKSTRDSPSSDSSSEHSSDAAMVAGLVVAGLVIFAFIIICVWCNRRKKKRRSYYMDPGRPPKGGDPYYNGNNQPMDHIVKLSPPPGGGGPGGWGATPPPQAANSGEFSSGNYSGQHHLPAQSPNMGGLGFSQSQFSYEELAKATSGFSQANLLGQGGFGYVHKGVLTDGRVVAVKSLKSGSGQGEREFQAEVEIISRVHHRHLVSLCGYCIADGQRMLVYEYVPNKTLEFHLHGKGQPVMDWATRLKLALGSAKGLAYIHEDCHPRIIHRDIKAANILLDNNFEALVADFGLAKLSSDTYTHVSTRVMGTFGYLAPEYASSGKLTEKSDVFSFGVMMLELITGKRPVDPNNIMEDSLVDWARPLLTRALEEGIYDELVDPRLEGNFAPDELRRMAACAAASIRHSAKRRPKMSQIVRALEGNASLEDLNDGTKPGQTVNFAASGVSKSYDTGAYNADMMKFRQMIMTSQEYTSNEYGATSDNGLVNPSGGKNQNLL